MALTYGDRDVRPLTADEVLRMVDAGIIGDDEPVELLHGVLTAVSPKSPAHEAVKARLLEWLAPGVVAKQHAVRVEAPIAVADRTSLPEPDVAVVPRGGPADRHPESALLVVEVAVTSGKVDLDVKPAIYADTSPEYWVVDIPRRCVHVFADPARGRYATGSLAREGDNPCARRGSAAARRSDTVQRHLMLGGRSPGIISILRLTTSGIRVAMRIERSLAR